MKKIVFVCLSHTLTEAQVNDLSADKIVLLGDVNAALAEQCKQINPEAPLEKVQDIAKAVVAEAREVGATHFVCQGEACLAMWANLFAFMHDAKLLNKAGKTLGSECPNDGMFFNDTSASMVCLQSTTRRTSVESINHQGEVVKKSVFRHVQWRNMFH